MTDDKTVQERTRAPVVLGRRIAESDAFWSLFHEGMALVEETASYLDGAGKLESRQLSRTATVAFGTESMRLTTRLMQLASWLLLQRAINEGSMGVEQGESERAKVRLGVLTETTDGPTWDELPATLRRLIDRSMKLQERIIVIDRGLRGDAAAEAANPVAAALGRIESAFVRR